MLENEKTSSSLPWTGERYVPELNGDIALEHLHRYAMARELAGGKAVLDIACGEGYGSAMLAEVAGRVIGVDASLEAIDHAALKYKKDNLEFKFGSCSDIPLPNACIDLVVSFETIEHHDHHEAMIREVKRVLRSDGVIVISSPEKHEYSEVPNFSNPFHVKELYRDEFEQLMAKYFKHIRMFGQRVVYGSGIMPESGTARIICHSLSGGQQSSSKGFLRPVYLIAVASDIELPVVTSGIFEQPISETEVSRLCSLLLADRDKQIVELNRTLEERNKDILAIESSLSWQITRPLRTVRTWLRKWWEW